MRTRWEGLPELLGLLWVIEGKGVEESGASDLELGLHLAASDLRCDLLDARLCGTKYRQYVPYSV